jgi:repressor LexA
MNKNQGITERQKELLKIIADFKMSFGYAPTLREMAGRLGVKSDQAVLELLGRLERHGALKRTPGIARSVVLS